MLALSSDTKPTSVLGVNPAHIGNINSRSLPVKPCTAAHQVSRS
jgi:hypothetical protein